MKIKICLVNANPLKEMGIVGQIYPPLGLLYLASYARSQFGNLEFLVIDGYKTKRKDLFGKIKNFNTDVIGVSYTTQSSTGAYEIINEIKKRYKENILVISGGAHPSISSVEPLTKSLTDYVVRGEGEIIFSEIIKCVIDNKIEDIKKINGVSYRSGGEIIDNPLMPLIKDISAIPFPARDLLDITDYPGYHYKKRKRDTSFVSTRGCPFNCVYCSNPVWKLQKPWYRTRTPKNIADEIEHLIQKYGITEFYDQTDEFNGNKKWAKAVCDELIKRKLDIVWKVQMRADNIDDELASKMATAGCWLGFFGIETGNDDTGKGVNKNISTEQSIRALKLLKNNGMKTFALLMAFNVWEENGVLKFEDKEKTLKTVSFAEYLVKNNLVDLVSWSLTTPYPGSKLYEIALRHKLIPEKLMGKWENWDSSANFVMKLPGIENADWLYIQRKGKILQIKLLLKSGTFNIISIPIYIKKLYKLVMKTISVKIGKNNIW